MSSGREPNGHDAADVGIDVFSEDVDQVMNGLAEVLTGPLPPAVRARVVAIAADGLGAMSAEDVPSALKPFRRFTSGRRAKLAATPIASTLETDEAFREHIADRVREGTPDLAAALARGIVPAAADPLDVAAAAFLIRPPGWVALVTAAADSVRQADSAQAGLQAQATVTRLQEQLDATRAQGRTELERLRGELADARAEVSQLRRKLGDSRAQARQAEAAAAQAKEALEQLQNAGASRASSMEAEQRRLRSKLAEVEAGLESARRSTREGRALEDARIRLLVDTVVEAAAGLRRELALPPVGVRPADTVAGREPASASVSDVAGRARDRDDPSLLDQLLALPQVHLIVDGYNVTKTGYGGLALEAQRVRLLTALAALAARCGAEVTCCFDGAALDALPSLPGVAQQRGVRVRFSEPGVTADELIRRLVRAEPPGRPVVVVSSDGEVIDGVEAAGARAVPAAALLKWLGRG